MMNQIKVAALQLSCIGSLMLFSCDTGDGKDPEPIDTTDMPNLLPLEIEWSDFILKDLNNSGSSADIQITYGIAGDLDSLSELRLLFTKASAPLDTSSEGSIEIQYFHSLEMLQDQKVQLDHGIKDTDGEALVNDSEYVGYLAAIPSNPDRSVSFRISDPFILKDEPTVTTLKLEGSIAANEDIAMGEDGSLYVCGGSGTESTVFKISPDGNVSSFSSAMAYPVGICIAMDGIIYVTNFRNTNINKITSDGTTTVFATDSRLIGGGGIIIDQEGTLYNTFFSQSTLYKITEGSVEEFASSDLFSGPVGMAYDELRDVIYVANWNDGKILQVEKDGTVSVIVDTPVTIGHLAYANDLFYVTGNPEHQVLIVSIDGEIQATIGSGSNGLVDGPADIASFSNPNGIEVSPDGKFIYVSQREGGIRKIIL